MTRDNLSYIFFGTGHIARYVLDELEHAGLLPALVVSAPDAKRGRGMELSPSLVGAWAAERGIETLKPASLEEAVIAQLEARSSQLGASCFVVVDYGYILPPELLAIPSRGILNMHPSLLPRLRGPSPIRSAILNDEREVGVSIIRIDEKMDHGPIVAQKKIAVPEWPASTPNRMMLTPTS
ncbi:MAG TPA: methionyl-tRNA formyltransferase, partial [Candidatus Paceibacterota bacterium]